MSDHPDAPQTEAEAAEFVLQVADDLDTLEACQMNIVALTRATAAAVERLRRVDVTWAEIGAAIGCTKQAAQQRYGVHTVPPAPGQLYLTPADDPFGPPPAPGAAPSSLPAALASRAVGDM